MAARPLRLLAAATVLWWAAAVIAEASPGRVSALGSVRVDDEVEGDVVVLGGDLTLARTAHVRGHAVAVFGTVEVAPGAEVDGRVIGLRSLASLNVDPALRERHPHLLLAMRLLNSGGWLLVTSMIALLYPLRLRTGVRLLPDLGLRTAAVGVMVYVTLLAALVAALGLGASLGVPLTAAILIVFLALKAVGLTVLGGSLGEALVDRLAPLPLPMTFPVFTGVAVLLAVRLLPAVGGIVWTTASIVALGASVLAITPAPDNGAPVPASV